MSKVAVSSNDSTQKGLQCIQIKTEKIKQEEVETVENEYPGIHEQRFVYQDYPQNCGYSVVTQTPGSGVQYRTMSQINEPAAEMHYIDYNSGQAYIAVAPSEYQTNANVHHNLAHFEIRKSDGACITKKHDKKIVVLHPGDDTTSTASRISYLPHNNVYISHPTPRKETGDLRHISQSSEGYFSHENIRKHYEQKLTDTYSKLSSGPFSRLHHPRKSPPLKQYYRTPSPPPNNRNVQDPQLHSKIKNFNTSMSDRLQQYTIAPTSSSTVQSNRYVMKTPSDSANLPQKPASFVLSGSGLYATPACMPNKPISAPTARNITILNHTRRVQQQNAASSARDESMPDGESSEGGESNKLNDSLTNIQWLGHMKLDGIPAPTSQNKDVRVLASDKKIDQRKPTPMLLKQSYYLKISKECGKKKRPPYSYMHLIQMAICSKPDKRMTLREIYKWIEDKFPYYKHHHNQGWKNSIRHNLSLYDIFVREKTEGSGKSGNSYWTLHSEVGSKTLPEDSRDSSSSPNILPNSEVSVLGGKSKKGLVPILPKQEPSSQQYAVIPIQGGVPIMPSQPIIVPGGWSGSPLVSYGLNTSRSSSKRSRSPGDKSHAGPRKKQVKIAPRIMDKIHASSSQKKSAHSTFNRTNSFDTSDLNQQLSQMNVVDSGIDMRLPDSSVSDASSVYYDKITKKGLPIPVMYNSDITGDINTRFMSPSCSSISSALSSAEKDANILSLDGEMSESGIHDILAHIEKDLGSPIRTLLRTPPGSAEKEQSMLTSTPLKFGSPGWISPIQGMTPSPLSTESNLEHYLFTPPDKETNKKTSTPNVQDSADHNNIGANDKLGSLRALGMGTGFTPLKTVKIEPDPGQNQSLHKLFDDIPIENIIEDDDMHNFSFSAFQ